MFVPCRYDPPEEYRGPDSYGRPKVPTADVDIRSLFPWRRTLRHIELCNIQCVEDGYNDLGFLSEFPALQSLHLYNVSPTVTSADLSRCTALQKLHIKMPNARYKSPLTLNLSNCTRLRELTCRACEMSSLNVSGCRELLELEICQNQITYLDLSCNAALRRLWCSSNKLEQLVLTGCRALEDVNLDGNPLTKLKVGGCTRLKSIVVRNTHLKELDLCGRSNLRSLAASDSKLTHVHLFGCTLLHSLDLNDTRVVSLDLTGLVGLRELSCCQSKLASLTLAECVSLAWLNLEGTRRLMSVDFSDCKALKVWWFKGSGLARRH